MDSTHNITVVLQGWHLKVTLLMIIEYYVAPHYYGYPQSIYMHGLLSAKLLQHVLDQYLYYITLPHHIM